MGVTHGDNFAAPVTTVQFEDDKELSHPSNPVPAR